MLGVEGVGGGGDLERGALRERLATQQEDVCAKRDAAVAKLENSREALLRRLCRRGGAGQRTGSGQGSGQLLVYIAYTHTHALYTYIYSFSRYTSFSSREALLRRLCGGQGSGGGSGQLLG